VSHQVGIISTPIYSCITHACLLAPQVCTCLRLSSCALFCCLHQSALALRPKDADLALAAAQALIAAHNYNRAIDYYNRCACLHIDLVVRLRLSW
jgi:hypothetical protein